MLSCWRCRYYHLEQEVRGGARERLYRPTKGCSIVLTIKMPSSLRWPRDGVHGRGERASCRRLNAVFERAHHQREGRPHARPNSQEAGGWLHYTLGELRQTWQHRGDENVATYVFTAARPHFGYSSERTHERSSAPIRVLWRPTQYISSSHSRKPETRDESFYSATRRCGEFVTVVHGDAR